MTLVRKKIIERLQCFDIKCSTSCQITVKKSHKHSQKTQRTGKLDSEKKFMQLCFLVSESKVLSLKELFVVFNAKVIVFLAESGYSSQRFVENKKLQLGLS